MMRWKKANEKNNARGFVIAIDSLLSLLILFTVLSLAFDTLHRDGSDWQTQRRLSILAEKMGEVLEESHIFSNAVIGNDTSDVRTFLNALPTTLCASVSAYATPTSTSRVFTVSKSGCTSAIGQQESVNRGIMVASPPDANLYVANITVWVNQS